jgi:tRNA threonylcarbamoyladenosine modification (KEOPS) complex  Pcc1 subunit
MGTRVSKKLYYAIQAIKVETNTNRSLDMINFSENGILISVLARDEERLREIHSLSFKYKNNSIEVNLTPSGFCKRRGSEQRDYFAQFSKDSSKEMNKFLSNYPNDFPEASKNNYTDIDNLIYEILSMSTDKINLSRAYILSWLSINGIITLEDQLNALSILKTSLPSFYLSSEMAKKLLVNFLNQLSIEHYQSVDIVPIHMTSELLEYLVQPFWVDLHTALPVLKDPLGLYNFLTTYTPQVIDNNNQALIVLDCMTNKGNARNKFLGYFRLSQLTKSILVAPV